MEDNERTQDMPAEEEPMAAEPQAEAPEEKVAGAIREGLQVIGEIERLMGESTQIPLTKSRVVKESSFSDLMGQLHIVLPKMVREARDVLDEQQEIISEARTDAKRRRDDADRYDRNRREEADHYSQSVKDEAEAFNQQVRTDADAYRRQVMEHTQQDADAIVADANTRAGEIVAAAKEQADRLVEENEITRRAQAFAMEIQEDARQKADAIYQQACRQVDMLLSGASGSLTRSAGELSSLRDQLLGGGQEQG